MPLIATVGRRSWRMRLLFAVLYALLIGGGITMIYPFLMMVSNSVKSNADWRDFRLIPRYFFDRREQFRKLMVEADHEQEIPYLFGHGEWFGAEDIQLSQLESLMTRTPLHLENIAADWRVFMKNIPVRYWRPYFNWQSRLHYTPFANAPQYQNFLRQKYSNDIVALNHAHGTFYRTFDDIWMLREGYWRRLWSVPDTIQWQDWQDWKATLDPVLVYPYPMEMEWWKYVRYLYVSVERYNAMMNTNVTTLIHLHLEDARTGKNMPVEHAQNFVYEKCNSMFYILYTDTNAWNSFLRHTYSAMPPEEHVGSRDDFTAQYPPVKQCPDDARHYALWMRYINEKQRDDEGSPVYMRTPQEVDIWSPVQEYRNFLRDRYTNNIVAVNKAYGVMYIHGKPYSSFEEITILPVPELLYYHFSSQHSRIMRTYIFGNYATVLNYVALHGRALWNTLIYIVLCIAGTLTINPMAAYALSRYRLSYGNKLLIFFLATMAFPAEVGMIPNFLMVRDLGLLNTFGALVLPGLANGFSIFLLKGFFDSLPPELYEAALIDGASEWTMFWRITLPLCKPILAVMTLGAFAAAYGAFMFAFLVCQDEKMWTLMVFLYQFQQTYANFMIMASLVITAIPTLCVFVLCQRVILRGIIIPTFK